MEERIPLYGTVLSDDELDDCATCSEKTVSICEWKVKRWCLIIALLVVLVTGCLIPLVIYTVRFGEATLCRLTYADDALVTEAKMQDWMSKESWPLSVPMYDWKRRTCVCKGYEDKDPKSLLPTDEISLWIAPGDLVSLSDEGAITPRLDPDFVATHRMHYDQDQHVKVCLRQQLVLDLWNIGSDVLNGGQHCHLSSGAGPSIVERFFLGWDGSLYCGGSQPACPRFKKSYIIPHDPGGATIAIKLGEHAYAKPQIGANTQSKRIPQEQYSNMNGNKWCCLYNCINWGKEPNCVEFVDASGWSSTIPCAWE